MLHCYRGQYLCLFSHTNSLLLITKLILYLHFSTCSILILFPIMYIIYFFYRLNVNKEKSYNDVYFKSTYTNYNLQSYYNSTHYYNNMDQGCVVYQNNLNQNQPDMTNQGNMHNIHPQKKTVPKFKSGVTKADRFHWVKPGEMIKA